jgi:hypothetical protein
VSELPNARLRAVLRALGLVLLVLGALGCSGVITTPGTDVPDTYSIDPAFDDNQAATIRDAFATWCASPVAYCPHEGDWTGPEAAGAIVLERYYPRDRPEIEIAMNDDRRVRVRADRTDVLSDRTIFSYVMLHELGHYGIDEHLSTGLMKPEVPELCGPLPLEIDEAAISAWVW